MSMLEKHKKLERNVLLLLAFSILVVLIGGLVEIVPLFRTSTVIEPVKGVRPYTPLELTGFNIYIREGCYVCHSQQIRPLRDEVARYGHYSLAAESMYDHPFQWGSKRTGPDLARVGGKYSDDWHVAHMKNPRQVVPESIMPSYSFLSERGIDLNHIDSAMKSLRVTGVPYTDEMIENAEKDALNQATGEERGNTDGLYARYSGAAARDFDGNPNMISEMDALIAYLQVLGTMVDFKAAENVEGGPQ
ncbi:MAG TPA: cytochrome-c oxidase, cbb3-type subunit II [Rhodospirillaceae bacterium]|nr:cytochrome-c oxidase, cbb3-type subunit II [Rhodospirillaceae bacterium]